MHTKPYFFSIIIPTYARPKQLAACLEAIARLNYPYDRFEVIVVDDGSEAPPEHVVKSFSERLSLTLLAQPNSGPASARNTGAWEAKGEFLAFVDDDCAPEAAWLRSLEAHLNGTQDTIVGGRTINALPDNPFAATSQLMTDAVYAYYNDDVGRANFFTTNNMAVPAAAFRTLSGFDTSFPFAASEDREFCERWLRQGYHTTYVPEAMVNHAHDLTFLGFCRQHFIYGRGALHFHKVRAGRGWEPLNADSNFYFHLFSYPFGRSLGTRALLFEVLFVLSYAAYTAGFVWEKIQRTVRGQPGGQAKGNTMRSSRVYSAEDKK
jgi:glycosyltransferase involved in cell wall biosynthesis